MTKKIVPDDLEIQVSAGFKSRIGRAYEQCDQKKIAKCL